MSCVPGCRWAGRAITWGPNSRGDFYSPRCTPSLLRALPLAPVGCVRRPDGTLAHRDGGLIRRRGEGVDVSALVGWIESATAHDDGVDIVCHLVDEAVDIRRVLLGLERARRLRWGMGLSIVARAGDFDLRDNGTRVVYSVSNVESVDFVSIPAGRQCYVKRRLPCPGVVVRDGLPVVDRVP
jgi:hypothetical protein